MNNETNSKILTINLEYAIHPDNEMIFLVLADRFSYEILSTFRTPMFNALENTCITPFQGIGLKHTGNFFTIPQLIYKEEEDKETIEKEAKEIEKLVGCKKLFENALFDLKGFYEKIKEIETPHQIIRKANGKNIIYSTLLRIKISPLSFDNQFAIQAFESWSPFLKDKPHLKPELIDYCSLKALILNSDYNNYKGFEIIPIDEDQSFLLLKKP